VTDSDEHDEEGHIIEDSITRIKMIEKRLFKKMPLIKKEISPPLIYGEKNPEIVMICWGSMFGIVKELIDELIEKYKIAMIHFNEIYPFSENQSWIELLRKAKKVINIEQNATSQFAKIIKMETGINIENHINRFDGRPFTVDELLEKVYGYIK
jgi:2-oxoglutarate ferredoxin oxidoreductase subunit alpha